MPFNRNGLNATHWLSGCEIIFPSCSTLSECWFYCVPVKSSLPLSEITNHVVFLPSLCFPVLMSRHTSIMALFDLVWCLALSWSILTTEHLFLSISLLHIDAIIVHSTWFCYSSHHITSHHISPHIRAGRMKGPKVGDIDYYLAFSFFRYCTVPYSVCAMQPRRGTLLCLPWFIMYLCLLFMRW